MMLLPGSLVVLLVASHAALMEAQMMSRRRGQMSNLDSGGREPYMFPFRHLDEDEKPVDLESSGDEDSFEDDGIDDVYSGSGSGDFELESGIETEVKVTTQSAKIFTTTPAMLPVTSVQPVGTPFEMLPTEEGVTDRFPTSVPYTVRGTSALVIKGRKVITTTPATPVPTTAAAPVAVVTSAPVAPTTSRPKATSVRRVLPPIATVAMRPTTTEATTDSEEITESFTDAATSIRLTTIPPRPRVIAKPTTTRTEVVTAVIERSTAPSTTTMLPVTEAAQTELPDVENEVEVPVTGGPSGDFEIDKEEGATRPELNNELVPEVTRAPDQGRGRNADTGIVDNTIVSGNTAAQLPQKNILERKEVLIAVIVGGVVGALFAAFLVMLLIYRMKKKDEGSYTLDEPKQASVTYQKPEKQEEFYA
ncbi:syndecan-3 [Ambystoma mexicanum]|uniref:syndecan-3 n=1 Tax=Ambystoma mexicanum TaxID=8296 RepID=UPI0037E70032